MVGLTGRRTSLRKSMADADPPEKNNSSANSVDSSSTASSSTTTGQKKRGGVSRKSVQVVETPPPRISSMTTRRQSRNARGASERIQRNQSLRTTVFKSYRPLKGLKKPATWRAVESGNAGGYTFYRGDIISIIDEENNKPYYAQVSTILLDSYGQPHAVIVYLIPLRSVYDPHEFDADYFVHGVAETEPIDLKDCTFVQRCPNRDSYRKEWTPKMCFEEQMRHELAERLQNLRAVSLAEMSSCDTSKYYTENIETKHENNEEEDEEVEENDDLAANS
uniref:BAH domain-containing protein n=1 Tax=Steinernema glaseri TaxID=37863 RepID=A0A1I8AJS1_9BILA